MPDTDRYAPPAGLTGHHPASRLAATAAVLAAAPIGSSEPGWTIPNWVAKTITLAHTIATAAPTPAGADSIDEAWRTLLLAGAPYTYVARVAAALEARP